MKSFRNSVDITPWDDNGHSAFGMTRGSAKFIGMTLILFSILLMCPPFIPEPSDLLNLGLGSWISSSFNLDGKLSLLLTYTLIPWIIFLIGIYIYPYNTVSLFNGYMNKLKKLVNRSIKNPLILIAIIIVGIYLFNLYSTML